MNLERKKPVLALTMGDPAGVGPEIVVKVALKPEISQIADLLVWGSPAVLKAAVSKFTDGKAEVVEVSDLNSLPPTFYPDKVYCYFPDNIEEKAKVVDVAEIEVGVVSAFCGKLAYDYVVSATKAALNDKVDAIVTAPVNKESINKAGIEFTGHTELIAEMCGTHDFSMQQSAGKLHIAFVTTHIPISRVCEEVTTERIIATTRLLYKSLLDERVENPKIAMLAVNPHAGEGGYMGTDEIHIVEPAVEILKAEGMDIEGPFPPDTLFIPSNRERFDAIVSMYHDQGHIPFKMLAFDIGVNSTLGLPIIRTSVDHGTAFNLAWKGKASTRSLEEAIKLAAIKASKLKEV